MYIDYNMENSTFQVIDGKLVIPEGVTTIERDSVDTFGVKELSIPNSVQTISKNVFSNCYHLEKLSLPIRFHVSESEHEENSRNSAIWNLTLDERMEETKAHAMGDSYAGSKRDKSISFQRIFKGCDHIKSISFIGDMHDVDFSPWDGNDFSFMRKKTTIRIEGEVKSLKPCEKSNGRNCVDNQYKFYINNYIENVDVIGLDKWTDKDLFFRAPMANNSPVDGKIAEFTLSPYDVYIDGKIVRPSHERWSTPIAISSDAVTYVKECRIPCFEDEEHIGTYLLLLGQRLEDIDFDKLCGDMNYPHVIVWESYDFVKEKLKKAGWNGR